MDQLLLKREILSLGVLGEARGEKRPRFSPQETDAEMSTPNHLAGDRSRSASIHLFGFFPHGHSSFSFLSQEKKEDW